MTIISKYLIREITLVSLSICGILLLILLSGRLVKYLSTALSGNIDPEVIFAVLGYRIPGFLELAFPLAFLLGILLTLGRLYSENEMSIFHASGISLWKLLRYIMGLGLLFAVLTATLSLYLSPVGSSKAGLILKVQNQRSDLDKITEKKFYKLPGDKGIVYAQRVSEDGVLEHVFLSLSNSSTKSSNNKSVIILSDEGRQQVTENDNNKFLVLNDGYRFVGNPGEYDYEITYFRDYASKLDKANSAITNQEVSSFSTAQLVSISTSEARAELQWRLSLPVMILVVVFLGVSLSKTAPRQGRYVRVLPAILIYFTYYTALNYASRLIRFDKLPSEFNLFYVHLLFVILSLILLLRRELKMLARLSLGGKS